MTTLDSRRFEGKSPGIIADMPRRRLIEFASSGSALPQMRFISFKVSHFQAFLGLLSWFQLLLYFGINTLLAMLLGRDTPKGRAARLRRAFERKGGSFIKLGLHLSMRVDFMPWVYSHELSGMVDRMEPFPVSQAIAIIERSTGKPLPAVFAQFDPEPIMSTSVACIYQALLRDGEKAVVKVRRPGIGEQFMADIEAFDWLLSIAEFLTIVRPGLTRGVRNEFRSLLMEELDFVQEARRQGAFRRNAAKSGRGFFSTPKIHLELSGEEVIINEFASGMWLWELLSAVEQGNEMVLAQARERNIDPHKVAQHLLWVNHWAREDNLFFHADPNPDNIIIGENSKLYFINFTTTGTLNRTQRQAVHQMMYYARQRDPQNMARASLVLMEPLPPIDVIELTQELETYNWDLLYASEASPDSLKWQERTSAVQWMGIIEMSRKYGIVLDLEVLRLLHSTLVLESSAVRLYHHINFIEEYHKFESYQAEQARRRVTDGLLERLDGKSSEQMIIRMDRIMHTAEDLYFRSLHGFSLPTVNFNALMSKWSFAVYIFVRFLGQALGMTLLAILVVFLMQSGQGQAINPYQIVQSVIFNPFYQIIFLCLVFVNGRTALFRMDDKEVNARQ